MTKYFPKKSIAKKIARQKKAQGKSAFPTKEEALQIIRQAQDLISPLALIPDIQDEIDEAISGLADAEYSITGGNEPENLIEKATGHPAS